MHVFPSGTSDCVKICNIEMFHLHLVFYSPVCPPITPLQTALMKTYILHSLLSYTVILSRISFVSNAQVLAASGSVPIKVSAALCAAQDAACSLQDLLQRERMISSVLKQVKSQH